YPHLRETAPGSALINTASAAAFYGMPGQSVYGATKAAIRSLSESLDAEWAADGIRVRALLPCFVETPLLERAPNRRHAAPIRQTVTAAGLEIVPAEAVAEAAWQALESDSVHHPVGKTARQMRFAARWMPAKLRKRARLLAETR